MTTRIDTPLRRTARPKAAPRLVTFIMGGDPDYATSLAIMQGAAESRRRRDRDSACRSPIRWPTARRFRPPACALKGGPTLIKTLQIWCARSARRTTTTPIVLMGYYNPIYIYGVDKFLVDAKAAGVDGLIVVDLPPEEDDELCLPALKAGLNFIRLATPTTDDKRLPAVLNNTSGFVYYVSITGITGAAAPGSAKVRFGRSRASSATPICRSRSASACAPPHSARAIAVRCRRRRGRLGADRRFARPVSIGTAKPTAKPVNAGGRLSCRPSLRRKRGARRQAVNRKPLVAPRRLDPDGPHNYLGVIGCAAGLRGNAALTQASRSDA